MSVLPAQTIRALCSSADERYKWPHTGIGCVVCYRLDMMGPFLERLPTDDREWWEAGRQLVYPYHERTRAAGKTFGLGPAGYDIRAAEDLWLWPGWGRLASAIEKFDVPRDVTFIVQDKSSWARCFVFAMNTNAEPGWRGSLTLELVRFLPWPIRIRRGDPIVNVMFLRLEQPTTQPYEGKYQDQEPGPQPARWDSLSEPQRRFGSWIRQFLGKLLGLFRSS